MSENEIKRVTPAEAHAILEQNGQACLIDVRSTVEHQYVGHPIGAVHVVWKDYPDWQQNPNFASDLSERLDGDAEQLRERPLLFICRSGARSMDAATHLQAQGFRNLYNVEEGFEGDKDAESHRGNINGWRYHGLPWEQG